MPQEHSKNCIRIRANEKEHNLTLQEYSRWLCLIEALEHVNTKAKQLKQDMEKTNDWIKPLSFQKYIDERFDTMVEEIAGFEKMPFEINIPKIEIHQNLCTTLSEPVLQ